MYTMCRIIIKIFVKLFYRVKIINKELIPKDGPFIIVSNHQHNFDCLMLMTLTKRKITFLAKKELLDGGFSFIFKKFPLIYVDRKNKNHDALVKGECVLKNKGIIGIFPEGTFNKTEYIIRPFKIGAVKMAYDTKVKIVPIGITGPYQLFKRVRIVVGKPYVIKSKDLKGENITLMNKVIDLMKYENNRTVKKIEKT